jgi:hypothetical protein
LGSASNVEVLEEFLKVCWDAISKDRTESLIQSMPASLQAATDVNGGLIPY